MAKQRPFRFGVVARDAKSREEWARKACRAEELGYATFLMLDHFTVELPPIAALMTVANATRSMRIGSCVFCNDYRHPAVLAKEVAALDVFSDGRFEFGIGAGWQRAEYEQIGIPFDRAGTRIDRLEEALHIFKSYFTQESVTFSGTHYTINELRATPKPVQKPHPPIYLGGGGKRMLSIAAREADIVGVVPIARDNVGWQGMSDGVAEATGQKVEWIRQAAGPRFDALELQTTVFAVVVTNHRLQVAERMSDRFKVTREQVLELTHCLVGTVDQMIEDLLRRREAYGISYIVVHDKDMEDFAPVVRHLSEK